jgi:hypothetical protein
MTPAAAAVPPPDAADEPALAPVPPVPRTLEDVGLPHDVIEQLLIKTLYGAEATGTVIAERMRLPYSLIEPLVERQRTLMLIEVKGATGSGTAGFRYSLTDLGRDRARQFLEVSHYVGPTPVPIAAYIAAMKALANCRGYVNHERLSNGFAHLIINDRVFEQLGPAINAGKGVFLYGPPGNGKTVIAEGMGRTLGGDMYVPHALDVDGHVVTVYDPISHESLDAEVSATSVVAAPPRDRRWIRIRRPVVIVGGELTLDMLDLTFNPISKFYEAPLQLKANGGVFLVDDFGRQRIRPQDLLNRWIVPLESRVDYLTLHTGKKFQIPFDVLTVFATNLDPKSLADEAFLRRIPYKIPIADPSMSEYTRIFEMNCRKRDMKFHEVLVEYLQKRYYEPQGRPLRACHPRDLIDQVTALCRYRGQPPHITRELLDKACDTYFVGQEPD